MKTPNNIAHNIQAHNKISKVYDLKHQEIYNSFEQDRLAQNIKSVVNKIKDHRPKVLDFGAGTGNLTKYFLEDNCDVTALDISEKSLEVIKQKFKNHHLQTKIFSGQEIPFADNTYDIVATYSVLHHIPDYLAAVKELIRVTKKGGYIFIDHEANEHKWHPNQKLKNYYQITKKTTPELFLQLIRTKEIFTYNFWQSFITTHLINPRHKREGDIHVWPDDHIEWNKIFDIVSDQNIKIIKNQDYLLYSPKITLQKYKPFSLSCSDTKFVLLQK